MSLKQKAFPTAPPNDTTPSAIPAGSGNNWSVFAVCVFLMCVIWMVFGQTLGYEFVNYDDNSYVYENLQVIHGLNLQGIKWAFTHNVAANWHPLTMISLMLDYQLHGLHAGGYHFTNVLLHTATAVLLFLVLRGMTGALWRSAFAAAIFAIHPLRVESVAWVTERKDMLSGLFFVLTLGAYVRYTRTPSSWARYLAVISLFTLGLLSKSSLVTLPFLLLLLDYWPLDRMQPVVSRSIFKVLGPLIIEKIPLFVLSIAACVVTILTQQSALAPVGELPLFYRTGYAAVSYVVYLVQMFYPGGLAFLYPFPREGLPLPEVVLALVLLAGLSAGVLALRRWHPYLVVGWLWYLGMLIPMIGMVHVGSVARADRFTYLPQIGLYILLTWAVVELTASWRSRRYVLGGGALVVLAVLIICARAQTTYWRDSESLWTRSVASTPGNSIAHNNLGGVFRDQGRIEEAGAQFQMALAINPDFAEAHNNLGVVLAQQGREEEAIAQFQQALAIKPDYAEAHYNLGNAFYGQGYMAEVIDQFQKALASKPDYLQAQNNLALVLATCPRASLRNGIEAVRLAERANQLAGGNNPAVLCTLAAAYAETGRFQKAIATAQRALQLAETQSSTALVGALQSQLKLYEAGLPFHETEPAS